MEEISLLESLLLEVDALTPYDHHKLDALRQRAEMIIVNLFPKGERYLQKLKSIRFHPAIFPADERYEREKWISGKNEMANLIKTMIEEKKLFPPSRVTGKSMIGPKAKKTSNNKIFIVHGHNDSMKQSVARTIEKLELDPVILHERPSANKTPLDKLIDNSQVRFAIILLSGDDEGRERGVDAPLKKRARQNVVFELGYFIGKLGKENVAVLFEVDPNFELPTDYLGPIYIPYSSEGRWQFDLVRELKDQGFDLDSNKIL